MEKTSHFFSPGRARRMNFFAKNVPNKNTEFVTFWSEYRVLKKKKKIKILLYLLFRIDWQGINFISNFEIKYSNALLSIFLSKYCYDYICIFFLLTLMLQELWTTVMSSYEYDVISEYLSKWANHQFSISWW